jgi:hypothetical protein
MSESIIQKYSEALVGAVGVKGKSHIESAGTTIRQGGESLLVGGALGAIHGTVGLDQKGVPLDGVAAAVALGAAIAFPNHPNVDEARNAGAVALGILGFRKTDELVRRKGGGSSKVHGDETSPGADVGADEDPVVRAARGL